MMNTGRRNRFLLIKEVLEDDLHLVVKSAYFYKLNENGEIIKKRHSATKKEEVWSTKEEVESYRKELNHEH